MQIAFFSTRVIVLSSVACPALPYFPIYLTKDSNFCGNKIYSENVCFVTVYIPTTAVYSATIIHRERDKLVAVITRTEQWPVSKPKMMLKYYKDFKQFTDSIVLNEG